MTIPLFQKSREEDVPATDPLRRLSKSVNGRGARDDVTTHRQDHEDPLTEMDCSSDLVNINATWVWRRLKYPKRLLRRGWRSIGELIYGTDANFLREMHTEENIRFRESWIPAFLPARVRFPSGGQVRREKIVFFFFQWDANWGGWWVRDSLIWFEKDPLLGSSVLFINFFVLLLIDSSRGDVLILDDFNIHVCTIADLNVDMLLFQYASEHGWCCDWKNLFVRQTLE